MTDEGIGVGELSRQVRDVLIRFQGLADRLDSTYVSKEFFKLYQDLTTSAIGALTETVGRLARAEEVTALENEKADKATVDELKLRVSSLEDDKKWLTRLVGAFIILGILGVVFAASGGVSPP